MVRSAYTIVFLIVTLIFVTAHPSVEGHRAQPVVPTPGCSAYTLTAAAKCKCSLIETFLPSDDYRLELCRSLFGDDLSSLGKKCDRFSVGATSHYDLAAMFAIEKLGGQCFPKTSCASYVSKSSVRTDMLENADNEDQDEYSLDTVERRRRIETIIRFRKIEIVIRL